MHGARYERGLFVYVRPPDWASTSAPSFWLAFRSVRKQDLDVLAEAGLPPDVPITLSRSRRLLFCPGCGVELDRFYLARWQMLLDPVILEEFELPTDTAG